MRKIGIVLFSLLILFSSCEKEVDNDNIDRWINGLWVNEIGDSLCFDIFLYINHSLPYDYTIDVDSLYTHRSWSSSLFDGVHYGIEVFDSPDELRIFNFLEKQKTTFIRHSISCSYRD